MAVAAKNIPLTSPGHERFSMKQAEQLALPLATPTNLSELFRRVFTRLRIKMPITSIDARFHPFAGLRSTVMVRNGALRARVSDFLQKLRHRPGSAGGNPAGRMFRRRPSREARECYLAYTFRPAIRTRIDAARRERGTKRLLPPRGRHHNLEAIFHDLNHRFFRNEIPRLPPGLEPPIRQPHPGPLRFRPRRHHDQPQTRLAFRSALSGRIRRLSRDVAHQFPVERRVSGAWSIRGNSARLRRNSLNTKPLAASSNTCADEIRMLK